jgi:TolB-like protein/Flp pilus assembly protein TadD
LAASVDVVDELLPGVDAQLEDAGACYLKHLEEPVHVYHIHPPVEASFLARASTKLDIGESTQSPDDASLSTCVAVMPIEVGRAGVEGVTLAALICDLLVTRLSTRSSMRVISRLSTEQFRLRGFSPGDVARRTGAAFLLAGRLHGDGQHAGLYLELIDAATEAVVWAETFAIESRAVLSADEGVTPLIAQAVVDRIATAELRRIQVSPLPNLPSQALQFAAIHLMHRQAHADFARSHEILEHLVDRHPRAAAPHAWLAQWQVLTVTKGWGAPTEAEGDRALGHTRRALDLNPDSAMSLAMEAFVHCHMKQDLVTAHERVLDALAINPNEPWAWLVRATIDSLLGRGEDAWRWALQARSLSPMDPLKHYFDSLAASAAVAAGRYVEAETLARMSLSKDSRHLPTLRALAIAQVHLGELDQARASVVTLMRLQPCLKLCSTVRPRRIQRCAERPV